MEEKLHLMKKRILESFKWREDSIVPLSKEFNLSIDEMDDFFIEILDMSSLESLHATFQTANSYCLLKRLHIDLRLCFFYNNLDLISKNQADELKLKLANEIENGRDYEEVLNEGRKELLDLIRDNHY